MTQKYTGMRKGISLIEMVIAIVLFAALATIGLKYFKNYINSDMQAKKARMAALTDQAGQLQQAFNLYKLETGFEPTAITDLNNSAAILTAIPTRITEISTTGWELNTSTGLGGVGMAFQLKIDLNGTTSPTASDEEYCAIFNREFNTSRELNVTDGLTVGETTAALGLANYGKYFCYTPAAQEHWIMVVVP